jgi:hypothetical protein
LVAVTFCFSSYKSNLSTGGQWAALGGGAGLAPAPQDLGQEGGLGLDGASEAALAAAVEGLGTAQAQAFKSFC